MKQTWPPWWSIIPPVRSIYHRRAELTSTLLWFPSAAVWLDGVGEALSTPKLYNRTEARWFRNGPIETGCTNLGVWSCGSIFFIHTDRIFSPVQTEDLRCNILQHATTSRTVQTCDTGAITIPLCLKIVGLDLRRGHISVKMNGGGIKYRNGEMFGQKTNDAPTDVSSHTGDSPGDRWTALSYFCLLSLFSFIQLILFFFFLFHSNLTPERKGRRRKHSVELEISHEWCSEIRI